MLTDQLCAGLAGVVVRHEATILRAQEVLGVGFDIDNVRQIGPAALGSLDAWQEADRQLSLVHALRSSYGRAHNEQAGPAWYLSEFDGSSDDLAAAKAVMNGNAADVARASQITRLAAAGYRVTVNTATEAVELVTRGKEASATLEQARREAEIEANEKGKASLRAWQSYADKARALGRGAGLVHGYVGARPLFLR